MNFELAHALITLFLLFLYVQKFWTYKSWAIANVVKEAKQRGECPICKRPMSVVDSLEGEE